MTYIVVFDPEKNFIGSRFLPLMVSFVAFHDFSSFGPETPKCFHLLNVPDLPRIAFTAEPQESQRRICSNFC